MVDVQFDEIVRIIAASTAQLVHIYYVSWMCQRLIDHSSGFHEVMYAYLSTAILSRKIALLFVLISKNLRLHIIHLHYIYLRKIKMFKAISSIITYKWKFSAITYFIHIPLIYINLNNLEIDAFYLLYATELREINNILNTLTVTAAIGMRFH